MRLLQKFSTSGILLFSYYTPKSSLNKRRKKEERKEGRDDTNASWVKERCTTDMISRNEIMDGADPVCIWVKQLAYDYNFMPRSH